ncbi:DUF732 domain-containing protein [Rhodococcus sp. OK302]|uniref:DUF732 domain-containing protein n=1 Tax=Rhodococcus sp. OK302 TaxID=1882769 RepID=UPI000B93DFD7|nr:DUF732 domain-containing protein [Rhodococcus sp. OK302]OYD67436.1 uncharacterized protein DUF732 [Rhodococcus sp. OK302]
MNTKRLILCLAVTGLLLSACGNESTSETASSTPSASTTAVAATSAVAASELETTSAMALPTSPPAPEAAPSRTPEALPALPTTRPAVAEANSTIDARSPAEIVAGAGERGQRYLAALRQAGIPQSGMDSAEILYADGTCKAIAEGMPRSAVLAEFKSVGDVYAQITPMPSERIAEIYVETAEKTYC